MQKNWGAKKVMGEYWFWGMLWHCARTWQVAQVLGLAAQSGKITQCQKASIIKHGHQIDGWLLCAGLCACPEISLESDSLQTRQKSFGWDRSSGGIGVQKNNNNKQTKDCVAVYVFWVCFHFFTCAGYDRGLTNHSLLKLKFGMLAALCSALK